MTVSYKIIRKLGSLSTNFLLFFRILSQEWRNPWQLTVYGKENLLKPRVVETEGFSQDVEPFIPPHPYIFTSEKRIGRKIHVQDSPADQE